MSGTNDTNGTSELGNTKPIRIRCRRWCYTWNEYPEDYDTMTRTFFDWREAKYCWGLETAPTTGTKHIQGYVEFKNPVALTTLKKLDNTIHWEKAKADRKTNIKYCLKDGESTVSTFPEDMRGRMLSNYNDIEWHPWQQEVLSLAEQPPDGRKIHWFWEPIGNVGKTFIIKYLYLKFNCIVCNGKQADVFNQVRLWMEQNEEQSPNLVVCDIPRSAEDYVSYSALEALKNGFFYSGKYEGGVCCFDIPTVIVMANFKPDYEQLSRDRWDVHRIDMNEI